MIFFTNVIINTRSLISDFATQFAIGLNDSVFKHTYSSASILGNKKGIAVNAGNFWKLAAPRSFTWDKFKNTNYQY